MRRLNYAHPCRQRNGEGRARTTQCIGLKKKIFLLFGHNKVNTKDAGYIVYVFLKFKSMHSKYVYIKEMRKFFKSVWHHTCIILALPMGGSSSYYEVQRQNSNLSHSLSDFAETFTNMFLIFFGLHSSNPIFYEEFIPL